MNDRRCEFCGINIPLNQGDLIINGKRHVLCHLHQQITFKRQQDLAARTGEDLHIIVRSKKKKIYIGNKQKIIGGLKQ